MLRFVVLGDPIAHSLSPRLHRAALDAAGIDGVYEARRVDAAGMRAAVEELRRGDLSGANVTMPHKQLAAVLADRLSIDAARAGSVNTLTARDGLVHGDNTDVDGIRAAWGPLPTDRALILGSGGAASAALLALEGRRLAICSRRPERAEALLARTGVDADVVPWGRSYRDAVVVNSTPLGMSDEPLPREIWDGATGLFDMVYGTVPTPAVLTARAKSIPAVEGIEMLIAQAAIAFRIWTGVDPSPAALRAAVTDRHAKRSNP